MPIGSLSQPAMEEANTILKPQPHASLIATAGNARLLGLHYSINDAARQQMNM